MHTWYFSCGKSKGHTTFLASSQLLGHELPSGSVLCQYCRLASTLMSVHLCFAFILRTSTATFKRESSDPQPGYNGVFYSTSSCASLACSILEDLQLVVFFRSSSLRRGSRTA